MPSSRSSRRKERQPPIDLPMLNTAEPRSCKPLQTASFCSPVKTATFRSPMPPTFHRSNKFPIQNGRTETRSNLRTTRIILFRISRIKRSKRSRLSRARPITLTTGLRPILKHQKSSYYHPLNAIRSAVLRKSRISELIKNLLSSSRLSINSKRYYYFY